MSCITCSVNNVNNISSQSKFTATASMNYGLINTLSATSKIRPNYIFSTPIGNERISIEGNFTNKANMNFGLSFDDYIQSQIRAFANANCVIRSNINGTLSIPDINADKFNGNKIDFNAYEKLYPSEDVSFINKSDNSDVSSYLSEGDIFELIDEGVFLGQYTENDKIGFLLSDDSQSQLFPSELFSDGDLEYKFIVNKPLTSSKQSYFAVRVSAPFDSYKDRRPQQYKIYDIKFEDPNGDLIIQYEDIIVKGDTFFTTYISQPKINNLSLNTWDANYPLMGDDGNYTIRFSMTFDCAEYPFDQKFDTGFEESCIISSGNDNTSLTNLKISSIEIGSSGSIGILSDNYINFFNAAQEKSSRVTKTFIPTRLFVTSFDNGIYPQSASTWVAYPQEINNETDSGANVLLQNLNSYSYYDYIELSGSLPHQDSGRLILKFDTTLARPRYDKLYGGAFNFGNNEINKAIDLNYTEPDIFFEADSIRLKIIAKKSENTPDFSIDVVGYSDDKILNVTPAIGGFLQNDPSVSYSANDVPDISGISSNSLTISENAISDDSDYYQKDISPFGDHYYVTNLPLVDSTNFAEYIIPLSIMHDPNKLGIPTKYGLTSFLENLYLDISPIPSGAIISNIQLLVDYIPSDAMMLHTLGSPTNRYMKEKSISLLPDYQSGDYITNTSGTLTNIPHGLSSPSSLKTNYSRRWRGIDNNVGSGAFSIIEFDNYEFAFTYPTNPFLYGYTDFRDVDGYDIYDNDGRRLLAEFVGTAGDSISDHLYQNIGWRLSSDQLFDNNPTTPYKSISWNSNIYDAFDRAVRVSGVDYYLSLGNVPLSSNGWAIFLRFTPDNTTPDNQCILSRINGSDVKIKLKYNGGNLFAEADNGNVFVETGLYWDECQYPLSVLLTYNDDGENRLKIYADNELDDNFTYLLGQSEIFDYYDSSNDLNIGHCELSGDEDLPMFIHEFGISNLSCNIVPSNLDRTNQETTIDSLFKSHRMHFWKTGDANYRSEQYEYINDNVSQWNLGAFKICAFSNAFDFFTKRDGNDYLIHSLTHDGKAYSEIINQPAPSSLLLSGVAYHTQVENDFLRFTLSDIPDYYGDTFYGIAPRISKNLPRGYNFSEQAICVDTIVEYDSDVDILWNNGKIGPKLIVSLYTPILNDDNRPSRDFGLINRSIHYLEPYFCYEKLTSKFTFDSLIDQSEPWAVFDTEIYQQEFKERYFNRHVDDMYLQYDLVYPSGSAFNANVRIHSANVRLDNSLVLSSGIDTEMPLFASGKQYEYEFLNLSNPYPGETIESSGLSLYTSGDVFVVSNNLRLRTSGNYVVENALNLHSITKGFIGTQNNFGSLFGDSYLPQLNIFVSGQYYKDIDFPLFVDGQGYDINGSLPIYVGAKDSFLLDKEVGNGLTFFIVSNQSENVFRSSSMPMYLGVVDYFTSVNNDANLYIAGYDPDLSNSSGALNLSIINYQVSSSVYDNSLSITWNSQNAGQNITSIDNAYAYVDSDDNIRGVDIICYGDCSSSNKCSETSVTIHGETYYTDDCVDGGIFRARTTYTNLELPSGAWKHTENGITSYDEELMYSGHFYGIRKYSGLMPDAPYLINVESKTGSNLPIDVPRELVEIEYNQDEEDSVSLSNQTLMNYNGIKIIAESEYRNTGNEFGKSIASKKDLLLIGAPYQTIDYDDGSLDDAGTVFIYKREDRPEGSTWPINKFKSPWILQEALCLPSGLRKDYAARFPEDKIEFPEYNLSIQKTRWYTGQEGRQFGHSVDLAINENATSIGEDSRQIIVVGGPSAKWSREFDPFEVNTINIGIMAFIDRFEQTILTELYSRKPLVELTYEYILQAIEGKDFLYKYFADPSAKFNINLIVYVADADDPLASDIVWNDAPQSYPLSITVKRISRNKVEADQELQTAKIINDMKDGFLQAFPSESDLPPIVGFYVDNSYSLGKDALQPALSGFMDFYKEYSYTSGNFLVQDSGQVIEFVLPPDPPFDPKNWIYYSNQIINDVLDSGNLTTRNQVRFISNSIGEFYGKEEEFNIPPESGGKVYIFEKEAGSWNLIQEIKSPNVTYGYPDRFGHAVSISDDGEIIGIGSPYINQAVMVYEFKPEVKDTYYNSIYSWIISTGKEEKYANAIADYALDNDVHALYLQLTPEDKFLSRIDLNIQEYQSVFNYGYGDIQPVGSWSFIPNATAPTARLGYSIDINEDGSKIVVGSPTDSMNPYNDADVYYTNVTYKGETYAASYQDEFGLGIPANIKSSWSSSVNAGAIHVFESRKYYPHNTVVEYGRFGNRHKILNNLEGSPDFGHFDHISGVFTDKTFIRTDFTQNSIPQDAGLLFIITPHVDSLSDEVADNLINWLALGDRNLVLVGNDPIWESNGAYRESNEIINKILTRLNSRMKIVEARNRYESLPNGYTDYDNILPSFVPYGATSTFTQRLPLKASGVADIRITNTFNGTTQDCNKKIPCGSDPPAIQIQSRCEMPLVDNGDLRAQSLATCCGDNGRPLTYYVNWPYEYKSYIPACADVDFNSDRRPFANFEPIPLLTAAEKVNMTFDVPAVPEKYSLVPVYTTESTTNISYVFGPQDSNRSADFIWTSTNNNYTSLAFNYTNKLPSNSLFFDPVGSGLIQANAALRIQDIEYEVDIVLDDKARYCASEKYGNTTSEVVLIANVRGEILEALTSSISNNYDRNRGFYLSLFDYGKSLAQLALWNNETSPSKFDDAVPNSILSTFLTNKVILREGINLNSLLYPSATSEDFDYAWIANIAKYDSLSNESISKIKEWLARGNKKLIITYDHYVSDEDKINLDKVTRVCEALGISMKPLKYEEGSYKDNISGTSINVSPMNIPNIEFIDSPYFAPYNPISITSKSNTLAYQEGPITQTITQLRNGNYWYMDAGTIKVSFPVVANSGYRLFITTDKHTDATTIPLTVQIGNASPNPELPSTPLFSTSLIDLINYEEQEVDTITGDYNIYNINEVGTRAIDIQVGENKSTIDIYISCNKARLSSGSEGSMPQTIKLMAISGVYIPILETFTQQSYPVLLLDSNGNPVTEKIKISDAVPGYTSSIEYIRTIQTDNTKYCTDKCLSEGLGGQLIEDGPIVAAQELEFITSFDAGYNRSRITLLTDPSMIQGSYLSDEETIPLNAYQFIRSLYPNTYFESTNSGRQFTSHIKIVSPERGSPSKYIGYAPEIDGLNSNFGGYIASVNLDNINKYESQYDPILIDRPEVPWKDENDGNKIEEIKNELISGFFNAQSAFGSTCRFSGIIDGTWYSDINTFGGIPDIIKDKGYDYIDFDHFVSGYPGDLFGYSVCIRDNKILVGSPFSAFVTEDINPWTSGSDLYLGYDGGAGSVYMFERTGNGSGINNTKSSWECVKKFRPNTLMGQLSGINVRSDQFGHSVNINNDILVVGAPNHNYGNYYDITSTSGSFVRKSFNDSFFITDRRSIDLGNSGIRNSLSLEENYGDKTGAIYVYDNKIIDWENKLQDWVLVEKINVNVNSSGNTNERFGKNVIVNQQSRSDADYSIIAGCENASGNNTLNIGAVYSKDVMLRYQSPSTQNPSGWITAKVFGYRDNEGNPNITVNFANSGDNSKIYLSSGVIRSNDKGEIFLEVSGQDPSTKGFIAHRPYIKSIVGTYNYGILEEVGMILYTNSKNVSNIANMNLFVKPESSAYVYNNIGLYNNGVSGIASESGLYLFNYSSDPIDISDNMTLYTSGEYKVDNNLPLRIRGK